MEEKKTYPVVASGYKLLEEVGQGVSATVYRATCIPFNEIVAIKSLDLEKCNSNLDEIRREAQTMSLISHPNVVKAHCSFVVDQSLWVVMPYMSGGSCLHIMKAAYPDGFDEPMIATVLKESLKALEYLHRHGHIHRDVKAGNILVDTNGVVKLGDFGVSACMFDTGDRQRSRNTFVGTPCWMAPEVMEQLHGYDFKADIWSFGITALELAHGHAPFSKYPPMKVLLMTLQNAPPGLDYERDKRFSKSFKEMIAMCLVKDPSKRPTAEKLLKHSFFKHSRSSDYISRHVLEGLPPLWERVKSLKIKDAARLAQKKMPYGEQEEKSQKEYQRGVSSWNFNVEDLKAQAALIQDDDEPAVPKVVEEEEQTKLRSYRESDDSTDASTPLANFSPQLSLSRDADKLPLPSSTKTETDIGDRVSRVHTGSLQASTQAKSNGPRSGPQPLGRKEPKHIGRFDVFEDDGSLGSPGWHESSRPSDLRRSESVRDVREVRDTSDFRKFDERRENLKRDERDREDHRRPASGPLIADHVVSSYRGREDDKDRDRDHRSSNRSAEDIRNAHYRERGAHSGPLSSAGAPFPECRPAANGASSRPGSKEGSEEKVKGPVIQKKGRFSVTTSDDVDMPEEVHHTSSRTKGSTQQFTQVTQSTTSFSHQSAQVPASAPTVPVSTVMSHLQNVYNHGVVQQDLILSIISNLSSGDVSSGDQRNHSSSKHFPRSASGGPSETPMEPASERERELMHQLAELQSRFANSMVDLTNLKMRNVQLERQLNAIYNKEEEERIRREEAAKEDG